MRPTLILMSLLMMPCLAAADTPDAPHESRLPPSAHLEVLKRTKFQVLDQSMESLLNQGWTITSMAAGSSGIGFLLQRNGKWVVCSLKTGKENGQPAAGSNCVALN